MSSNLLATDPEEKCWRCILTKNRRQEVFGSYECANCTFTEAYKKSFSSGNNVFSTNNNNSGSNNTSPNYLKRQNSYHSMRRNSGKVNNNNN